MAKFRVETQLAIDKASAAGAKVAMEGITKAATQLGGALVGGKAFLAPFQALRSVIEDSIAASDKASASQDRIKQAMKGVYSTIGDELTPGMNELAISIQQALNNPEVMAALRDMGSMLGDMATGVSALVDEIGGFSVLKEVLADLHELVRVSGEMAMHPVRLVWSPIAMAVELKEQLAREETVIKKAREHQKVVGELSEAVSKWAKGVGEQQKAEEKAAEARRKAHAEHLKALQTILDKVNPIAKAERETWEQILILNQALKAGELDVNTYQQALAFLTAELKKVQEAGQLVAGTIPLIEMAPREWRDSESLHQGGSMTVEAIDTAASLYNDAFEEANQQLSANLQAGLTGAFTSALVEFANGGEDAFEHFGESMRDVLLNSVAEWLAAQLKAIAIAAAKAAAVKMGIGDAGGSGGGGGGWMGAIKGLFGGGGATGSSSSAGAGAGGASMAGIGIYAAVVVAALAIMKHQMDRSDAVRYNTSAGYNTSTTGAAFSSYGGKLQETGAKIAEAFKMIADEVMAATGALIDGAHSAGIAIRNDKKQFQAIVDGVLVGTFKTAEEAMVAAMKTLFQSGNLQRAIDPVVQQVIDNFDASRGPDAFIEAIKTVTQIMNETSGLTELEVTLRNLPSAAAALSANLVDMGVSIGDATAVAARWTEQQFASIRDQITGHQQTAAEQRAEKERQAAYFNAQLALARANMALMKMDIEAKVAHLEAGWNVVDGKMEIDAAWMRAQRDMLEYESTIVVTRDEIQRASYAAQIAALNIQLEAVNAAMVALDAIKPIDFREINIGNIGGGGHGGGNVNPGPSEAEQRAESFEAFLRERFLSSLTDLQRRLEEINTAYAEQAQAASEVAGGEAALAAAREAELIQLRGELIDGLGLPMEDLRDRFAALRETLAFLRDEVERTGQGGARLTQVMTEFGDMMRSELLGLAAYFTDALGDTETSAAFRRQMAEMEWDIRRAQFRLTVQELALVGAITPDEAFAWLRFLEHLPDNLPDAGGAGSGSGSGGGNTQHNGNNWRDSAEDALRQALERLRNAIDGLREFQEGMLLSSASPLTISQQYEEAARQYAELLAAAQGGDIGAMEQLAGAAQTYLDLAAQMFGTAGSGYGAIFEAVSQQIAAIVAAGQGVLDGAPPQMQGTEQRLDTIAEILNQMRLLYGGAPTWHPPTGQLPLGGGSTTLGNFGGNPGVVSVRSPEITAELRAIRAAQEVAATEAKADRMKRPSLGLSGFYGQSISNKRSA